MRRPTSWPQCPNLLAVAEERLPLDQVASGPADELGLGREFAAHQAVDFIVQDLGRFPGRGWTLLRAALRSPVVRNRNMAHRALSAWGQASWPEDPHAELEAALAAEPVEEVRRRLERLLRGEPLDGEGAGPADPEA